MTRIRRLLPAQGVRHNVRLARMVFDSTVIIVQEFNPATLPHVEHLLVENMLKTLVIGIYFTLGTVQVMSPDFQRKDHRTKFQVMSSVVLLMNLELTRSISNNLPALHQHTTETTNRSVTVHNEVIRTLR